MTTMAIVGMRVMSQSMTITRIGKNETTANHVSTVTVNVP